MGWWYVRRMTGENVGPIEDASVMLEIDAGRLPANGWVFEAGGTAWRRVDEVTQFSAAVHRAMEALGDAPTLYSAETKSEQKSFAALYEAHVEGPPSPSRPPTAPAPPVPPAAQQGTGGQHGTALMPAPAQQQPAPVASPAARDMRAWSPSAPGHGSPPPAPQPMQQPHAAPQPAVAASRDSFGLAVVTPASTAPPPVVDNPLTESRGAAGWLAIGFAAASAMLYFMGGTAGLVSLAFAQGGVFARVLGAIVSYACVGLFAWCSFGLFRRRVNAYRVVMAAHVALVALILLGVFVEVMLGSGFHWIVLVPGVLVVAHIVGICFAYAARGVFWIRT